MKKCVHSPLKTLLVVASAGGHLAEARTVIPSLKGIRIVLLTERLSGMVPAPDEHWHKVYTVPFLGMGSLRLLLFLALATLYFLVVLVRERPQAIFSTGAEIALPAGILGKLFRKRLVFLESLTRLESLSLTGRILLPWADLFLVQHASLARSFGPRVSYWGNIL